MKRESAEIGEILSPRELKERQRVRMSPVSNKKEEPLLIRPEPQKAQTLPFEQNSITIKEKRKPLSLLRNSEQKKPPSREKRRLGKWCICTEIKISLEGGSPGKEAAQAAIKELTSNSSVACSQSLDTHLKGVPSTETLGSSLFYWGSVEGPAKSLWKESFKSIYFSFKNGKAQFFYFIQSQSLSILFSAAEGVPKAFVKGSQRLVEELLETVSADSAAPKGLSVIEGAKNIHFLFDYVLNQPDENAFNRQPVIYSHYPFLNGALLKNAVCVGQEKQRFVRVSGAVLPPTREKLAEAFGASLLECKADQTTVCFDSV
ncbi:MAG: uncharacterized protein A8A55_1846 [Amphiamblys sp. WSBS2006]|nr:MAG: uncharacterized protein A8A55_1846 [Amphiamblys sp. WSBS2006]